MEHFCEITEAKAWIVPLKFEKIDYKPIIEAIRFRSSFSKHILVIDSSALKGERLTEGTLSFSSLLNKVDLNQYPKDYLRSFKPNPEQICDLMPPGGTTGLPKLLSRTHND